MMARGEFGLLIAASAESPWISTPENDSAAREDRGSEMYLVVIWTVVLCTVVAPVSVGFLVGKVNKLQKQRQDCGGSEDAWEYGMRYDSRTIPIHGKVLTDTVPISS